MPAPATAWVCARQESIIYFQIVKSQITGSFALKRELIPDSYCIDKKVVVDGLGIDQLVKNHVDSLKEEVQPGVYAIKTICRILEVPYCTETTELNRVTTSEDIWALKREIVTEVKIDSAKHFFLEYIFGSLFSIFIAFILFFVNIRNKTIFRVPLENSYGNVAIAIAFIAFTLSIFNLPNRFWNYSMLFSCSIAILRIICNLIIKRNG